METNKSPSPSTKPRIRARSSVTPSRRRSSDKPHSPFMNSSLEIARISTPNKDPNDSILEQLVHEDQDNTVVSTNAQAHDKEKDMEINLVHRSLTITEEIYRRSSVSPNDRKKRNSSSPSSVNNKSKDKQTPSPSTLRRYFDEFTNSSIRKSNTPSPLQRIQRLSKSSSPSLHAGNKRDSPFIENLSQNERPSTIPNESNIQQEENDAEFTPSKRQRLTTELDDSDAILKSMQQFINQSSPAHLPEKISSPLVRRTPQEEKDGSHPNTESDTTIQHDSILDASTMSDPPARRADRRATVDLHEAEKSLANLFHASISTNTNADQDQSLQHQDISNPQETVDDEGLAELLLSKPTKETRRIESKIPKPSTGRYSSANMGGYTSNPINNAKGNIELDATRDRNTVDNKDETQGSSLTQSSTTNSASTVGFPEKNASPTKMVDTNDSYALEQIQRSPSSLISEKSSSYSSPPPRRPVNAKSPLKSCLSAIKVKPLNTSQNDKLLGTPSKRVNFGPAQSAEFNSTSPPTSMTPMCAKAVNERFPLEHTLSSQLDAAEEDLDQDSETELNTSILEEADSKIVNEENDADDSIQHDQVSISGRVNIRNRRYSLRGVSPLDSRRNAQRRRKSISNDGRSYSWGTSFQHPMLGKRQSKSPPRFTLNRPRSRRSYGDDLEATIAVRKSSLNMTNASHQNLNHTFPQPRISFADSSESESGDVSYLNITNDDMELTGEYGNRNPYVPATVLVDAQPPKLSDLLKEVGDDTRTTFDGPLNPIIEEEDHHSRSFEHQESEDEDETIDVEYDKQRKSLVVNLSSKFDKIGSSSPKKNSKKSPETQKFGKDVVHGLRMSLDTYRDSSVHSLSYSSISGESLLKALEFENNLTAITTNIPELLGEQISSLSENEFVHNLCEDVCAQIVIAHDEEIISWSSDLADILQSLLSQKMPQFVATMDNETQQAVHSLLVMEARSVVNGWSKWRKNVENNLRDRLDNLNRQIQQDLTTLQSLFDREEIERSMEISVINELMDAEIQMSSLLDAIEEQDSIEREYADAVQSLEKQCSSLILDENVLEKQYHSLTCPQDLSVATQPGNDMEVLQKEVSATEDLFTLQDSIGLWKIHKSNSTLIEMKAHFHDVITPFNILILIAMKGDNTFQIEVQTQFHEMKQTYGKENDVVQMLAQYLLSHERFVQYCNEEDHISNMLRKLWKLESDIFIVFDFLTELRTLSMDFAMWFDFDSSRLWIDFIQVTPNVEVNKCCKFAVGFLIGFDAPFTTRNTEIAISYGQVSEVEIMTVVENTAQQTITNLCSRLKDYIACTPSTQF